MLNIVLAFTLLSFSSFSFDYNKSLIIKDISVVEKLFPFDEMMEGVASGKKGAFIQNWLGQWNLSQLNSYPLVVRPAKEQILSLWPKMATGELDFSKSPFRLLTVVNRMDLVSSRSPNGEFRLVYCLYDRQTKDPLDFTVIFEFKIPKSAPKDYLVWKKKFYELSSLDFGPTYNQKLQEIYGLIIKRENLLQVRTNDFFLDFIWELREFRFVNDKISHVVTAQTPDRSFDNSDEFNNWVKQNIASIEQNSYIIPDKFLASSSVLDTEEDTWSFKNEFQDQIRHKLSLNTCNGCHGGETQTVFTHIKTRREGQSSYLSDFLLRDLPVRKKIIDGLARNTFLRNETALKPRSYRTH